MADKILNTRIQLKFDTLETWNSSSLVLKEGEAAVAIDTTNGSIIVKYGDGDRTFAQLAKPLYEIADIPGLSDRLGNIADSIGDTNTTYRIVKDGVNFKLQAKEINGDWADSPEGAITLTDYVLKADLERDYASLEALGEVAGNVTAVGNRVTTLENNATNYVLRADLERDYATLEALGEVANDVSTLQGQISGITGAMHFKGIKTEIPSGADLESYADGDVILVGEKEYVFNNGGFVEFGDATRLSAVETKADTNATNITKIINGTQEVGLAEVAEVASKYLDNNGTEVKDIATEIATAKSNAESASKTAASNSQRITNLEGRVAALEANIIDSDNLMEYVSDHITTAGLTKTYDSTGKTINFEVDLTDYILNCGGAE